MSPRKPLAIAMLVFAALVVSLAGTMGSARAASAAVYDDSLHWDNWSWGTTVDTNATAHVREGSASMAVTYNQAWAGLQLHNDGFDTSPYTRLAFDLHADGHPLPSITAKVYNGSSSLGSVAVADYATSADGGWHEVSIPLADLNADGTTVTRLLLQDRSGGAQPTFYVDGLRFASDEASGVTFTVTTTERGDDANPGDRMCSDASGRCTLEAAFQEASALDDDVEIQVPQGNYVARQLQIAGGGAVRVVGAGIGRTVIDANFTTALTVAEGADAVVESITLTGGHSSNETGGVDNSGNLVLRSVEVADNSAGIDGGRFGENPHGGVTNRETGRLDIIDSVIRNNDGEAVGGVVNRGTMAIVDSEVVENGGFYGPGGIANSGTLRIERSQVNRNTAFVGTGGIGTDTTVTIVDSVVAGNESGSSGGQWGSGLTGPFTLEGTTVSGNKSTDDGYGVFAKEDETIILRNSHIVDNTPVDCNRYVDEFDAASSNDDGTCIPPAVFIYDNWTHWDDWSWSTSIDRGDTDPVYGGDHSMRVTFNSAWAGLSFHDDGFGTSDFEDLRFAIHTGGNPFPNMRLYVHGSNGSRLGTVDPRDYQSDAGDGWVLVSVPLADLGAEDTTLTRVTLQEASGSPPPAFNIDGYGFFKPSAVELYTFNVTSTEPADDANPGDGECRTAEGECTVQAAFQEADQHFGEVTINMPEGFYEVSSQMKSVYNWPYSLAVTRGTVTVVGAGADQTTIEPRGDDYTALYVEKGSAIELIGLRLHGSDGYKHEPGLISNYGTFTMRDGYLSDRRSDTYTGILRNEGTATLENVVVEGGIGNRAGGIYSTGTMTIRNSKVLNNEGGYLAGGVGNRGSMVIEATEITGNTTADGRAGGISSGGDIVIRSSLIANNGGNQHGGVEVYEEGGHVIDTIIRDNTGGNGAGGLGGSAELERVSITDNTSVSGSGGGIDVGDEIILRDSEILNNTPNDCSEPVIQADAASSDSDGTCIPDDEPTTEFIYDNWTHWDDWSWSTSIDRGDTDPVYGGDHSMRVTFNSAWAGLSFHDGGFDTSDFSTLQFAVHTGGNPFPNVRLYLHDAAGNQLTKVDPRNYDSDAGDGWRLVTVPLADLGAQGTTITRVTIQEASGSAPPLFNIDGYGFWGE